MRIFTIGHSRHAPDAFLRLLRMHEIDLLVDVRSSPCSKWAPHFDKLALDQLLTKGGLSYVFLGRQLGGRPDARTFYRADGTVDYARRAGAPDFVEGIELLSALARGRRAVVLCAEEDPTQCHRRLLVAPALLRAGADVVHIRGDGRLEAEPALAKDSPRQLDLFGERT